MYDTEADYERAEAIWWERLQAAVAREHMPLLDEVTGDR